MLGRNLCILLVSSWHTFTVVLATTVLEDDLLILGGNLAVGPANLVAAVVEMLWFRSGAVRVQQFSEPTTCTSRQLPCNKIPSGWCLIGSYITFRLCVTVRLPFLLNSQLVCINKPFILFLLILQPILQ